MNDSVPLYLDKESIAEIITGLNELMLADKGTHLTNRLIQGLMPYVGKEYEVVR